MNTTEAARAWMTFIQGTQRVFTRVMQAHDVENVWRSTEEYTALAAAAEEPDFEEYKRKIDVIMRDALARRGNALT